MKLRAFFWHYLRRYTGWALLASAGIIVFAAATAGVVSLIKPIFGEVLLAGDQVPGALGGLVNQPAETPRGSQAKEVGPLADLKKRFNVARQIDRSYQSLKRRLGVHPDEVVYFVPLLLVVLILLRNLADFFSGYAFQ